MLMLTPTPTTPRRGLPMIRRQRLTSERASLSQSSRRPSPPTTTATLAIRRSASSRGTASTASPLVAIQKGRIATPSLVLPRRTLSLPTGSARPAGSAAKRQHFSTLRPPASRLASSTASPSPPSTPLTRCTYRICPRRCSTFTARASALGPLQCTAARSRGGRWRGAAARCGPARAATPPRRSRLTAPTASARRSAKRLRQPTRPLLPMEEFPQQAAAATPMGRRPTLALLPAPRAPRSACGPHATTALSQKRCSPRRRHRRRRSRADATPSRRPRTSRPSTASWRLRQWAASRSSPPLPLVAGHTHRPHRRRPSRPPTLFPPLLAAPPAQRTSAPLPPAALRQRPTRSDAALAFHRLAPTAMLRL